MTDPSVVPRRLLRHTTIAIYRRRAGMRVLTMLAALAIPLVSLPAQRIALSVGDSTRVTVTPGTKLAVPIGVDLSAASSATLASLQAGLTWGSTRLIFDSLRVAAASGFSLTPNLAGATGGSLTFNTFGASALPASGPIATAYFTATATTGGTSVVLTPATAGSALGANVLSALNVRNLGVCVAPVGKWGDVNDDGTVNIIDAQQIARSSVGLSVANPAAVSGRGDVTADGTVNIIDAQQIARASVALSAAARVNTAIFTPPVVHSVTLTPGSATSVVTGSALALAAVPKDSAGVDLGGCAPVTWSSSNPSTATVSSGGVVVAVATGSATITATSGTRSATVPITVSPPYVLALTTVPVGGTSNTFLPTQPVVSVQTPAGAVVSGEVRQVTATLASGSGSLSGTTTVSTVNGVATFTDLAITGTGAHTLAFTTTGTAALTSGALTMVAPTSMRLLVGATPSLAGTAATDVVIPVLLDLSGRGSQDLAAITARFTWDPTKYTYVGNDAGTWVDASGGAASVTVNATNTASGTLSLTGFTTDATTASATLRTITLRPVASGPVVMSATVSTAGNVNGTSVTVVPRNLGGTVINPAVATVVLDPPGRMLPVGQSIALVATARDGTGSALIGRTFTWASANSAIAAVNDAGQVTAVSAGTTTIIATAGDVSGTVMISIAPALSSLSLVVGQVSANEIRLLSMNGDGSGQQLVNVGIHPTQVGDLLIARGALNDNAIYSMSGTGAGRRQILDAGPSYQPHLSNDATKPVLSYGNCAVGNPLATAVADGSGLRVLGICIESAPRWSPDGTRIAYAYAGTLYTVRADGADVRSITGPSNNLSGSWSPDGSRFLFSAKPSGDANHSLFVMNIDGTNLQRLTTAVGYNDFNPDLSQDGAWVVFTSTRSGSSDAWAMTADGANVTRLTTSSNPDWDPRWKRAAPTP
jgi:uncharacterized protein YjdB